MSAPIIVYTDGGARGNPGPAAVGVVIATGNQQLKAWGQVIGTATNNEAEYQAVLASLTYLNQHKTDFLGQNLEWRMDSLLIASQLMGKFKIKEARLKDLAQRCKHLFQELGLPYQIKHIPRHQNAAADALVNQALDATTPATI